ncbi:MAG TPA: hypothetical protein VH497_16235 [Vicinamibacterales bacterium]|jgi:hypothetical protein
MRGVRTITILALSVATAALAPARNLTTCDAANPYDDLPDDAALQACLDNFDGVLLQPPARDDYVGYLIAKSLELKRDGTLLTTARNPAIATVRAAPGLASPVLRVVGANNYEISFVRFDGNRDNRAVRDKPCSVIHDYTNVELSGTGYHVRYVESTGAVCGSAMTVGGSSGFEIYRSLFYDNGRQPEEANGITGLWSDGLTVYGCNNSAIHDNILWDNTDVDLGVNGGTACAVYRNTISHSWKYAFAGLVVGDPTRSGGEFSNNQVSSGYDLLGFGILVGCHPWSQCHGGYASNVSVYRNLTTGAVVNFAVDGLNGGSVHDNTMSGSQGNRVLNCRTAADYTVGHAINVSMLQPGYVVRTYDAGTTCQ